MFRAAINKRLICALFFPFSSSSDNKLTDPSKARIIFDKVKDFMYKEDGTRTKEMQSVLNSTFGGMVTGFILGGIAKGKDVGKIYRAENQATLYNHKFEAIKDVNRKVGMSVIRGGLPIAAKLGFFCFVFSTVSSALYVHRAKFDLLNSMAAGAVTGFIYKSNMGLKGAFAGTLLGTILGTVYGIVAVILLFVTGVDMNDLYESSAEIMNQRREKIKEKSKLMMQQEESGIRLLYEQNKTISEQGLPDEKGKKKV